MSVDTGLLRGLNPYAEEAEIQLPTKYIVTFVFKNETTLDLPYTDELTVKHLMSNLVGKSGLILIHSKEPVPSMLNIDEVICITPSLYRKEGQ